MASLCLTLIFIVLCTILYGAFITTLDGLLITLVVVTSLILMFSLLGVLYGIKIGDFRAVPAPSILIAFSFWIISGSINPLEFSSGSDIFKLTPTASALWILNVALFSRGLEYVTESCIFLLSWCILSVGIFLLFLLLDFGTWIN